jgi:4-amino-4-deoxy-L-arabinose transferase-like glycosyltransferase
MTAPARAVTAWLAGWAVVAAAASAARSAAGPHGLLLTVQPAGSPSLSPRSVPSVDLRDLRGDPRIPNGPLTARWDGFWLVTEAGAHKLVARSEGAVALSIDGAEVFSGRPGARPRGVVDLLPGFHRLALTYETAGGPDQLRLLASSSEEPRQDLEAGALFRAVPTPRQQAWGKVAGVLGLLAWAVALGSPLILARQGGPRARRALAAALPVLVVLYAAALRFEALVGRYAWDGPRWAIDASRMIEAWHPASLRWPGEPELSGGDPFHYLRRARTMTGFYEADVREPLFPYVIRGLLRLLGERAVAVNAAAALFSTLTVLATYGLGAAAFSRAVGLGAALTLAVERDALWWSVEGFRDDAFTLFVVLSALALVRLRERPSARRGVWAGLAAGGACLSRVTSLSYLLPAHAVLLCGRGESAAQRRRALGLSLLVLVLVAGPYLLACALAYGDPFYAVNFHTRFYRSRAGLPAQEAMGWLGYLRTFPLATLLETGLRGLTVYPFANKWHGLEYLAPGLGLVLAGASLVGLALFAASPAGRLLLVVLMTSLLPYAFTWRVPGGAEWRFTMHAYPFYLIAAWLALTRGVRWLLARRTGGAA